MASISQSIEPELNQRCDQRWQLEQRPTSDPTQLFVTMTAWESSHVPICRSTSHSTFPSLVNPMTLELSRLRAAFCRGPNVFYLPFPNHVVLKRPCTLDGIYDTSGILHSACTASGFRRPNSFQKASVLSLPPPVTLCGVAKYTLYVCTFTLTHTTH